MPLPLINFVEYIIYYRYGLIRLFSAIKLIIYYIPAIPLIYAYFMHRH